jgi:hypothetical protein
MADPFAALNTACLKTFGTAVSYQQGTAEPFPVSGIISKDTDEERHQDGVYLRLFVQLADFAVRPDHGDVVTIDGVAYTVFEVLTDAAGGAYLSLRASS